MCKVRLRMITPPAVCLPRAMDAGGRVGAAARSGASRSGLDGVAARAHARVECLAALLLAIAAPFPARAGTIAVTRVPSPFTITFVAGIPPIDTVTPG